MGSHSGEPLDGEYEKALAALLAECSRGGDMREWHAVGECRHGYWMGRGRLSCSFSEAFESAAGFGKWKPSRAQKRFDLIRRLRADGATAERARILAMLEEPPADLLDELACTAEQADAAYYERANVTRWEYVARSVTKEAAAWLARSLSTGQGGDGRQALNLESE